ncbi:Alpha-2-macroglobulin-like 9, partial [Homarus americanus]
MVVTSLSRLLVCVLALVRINLGGYVVTTPQRWTLGGRSHVCVVVTEPHHSPGHLTLTLNDTKNVDLTPLATLHLPPGRWSTCEEVEVGEGEQYHGKLRVEGLLGGEKVDHTATLSLVTSRSVTFIQTDKYYYQPGHTVHFRILTLHGAFLNVSTNTYPEVWVETPSRTRVAQWRDVDNAPGLVHLAMALADEPQQGVYTIFVRTEEDKSHSTTFMVEQYVLPRFQVTIVPPEYLLLTHTSFFFTVCARYTFGQSVRGEVRLEVSNGLHRNCRVLVIKEALILGCQNVGVEAREVLLEECGVYRVTVQATVTEDGTGVQQAGRGHVTVSSQPVVFTTVYSDQFMKPNLPFTIKVRGELPDGTPAPGVALEMCAAGVCTNTTTSQDGSVTAVLPSYTTNRFFLKTLGCSARVQSSLYNLQVNHYVSPSNSSLMIYAPDTRLKCDPGAALRHYLPVMFSATNTTRVSLNVQVVSRGLVQYWKTEEYQMNPGVLPISVEHLVGALSPPPPHTVRGVLMWYTREDGEVVSDARDLEVERCLGSEVRLEWREDSTQPGALTALSLSSRPHSLCSLGVVDRSTELLSTREDPITLEKIFDFVNTYEIYPWGFRPGPCENQETAFSGDASLRVQPLLGFPPYPVFSEYVDAAFMFHTAGLLVFSDLRLVAAPCDSPELFGNIKDVNNPVLERSSSGGGDEGIVDARTSFPETWLFDLLLLPSSGVTRQEVRAPDTITQWVGKAVCVSPDHHVGVSLRANLTTFTPFFLDLTLPPSVKRGEIL